MLLDRTPSAVDRSPPSGRGSVTPVARHLERAVGSAGDLPLISLALVGLALTAFAFTGLVTQSRANGGGVHCGAYVTHDVTLHRDVFGCVDGGLIAGRSGITIDLNGHSITGLGEGDGISLAGVRGVTVRGGSVANFEVGIRLMGATKTRVSGTRLAQNSDASLWAEGSNRNAFRRLTMTENGDGGFRLIRSSGNRIAGNRVTGASDSGVYLEELSSHNRIVRNKVTLAGEGIKVDGGSNNRIVRNTTSWNGGAGIEIAEATYNTRVKENKAHRNGADGIFVEAAGTRIRGNRAGCNGGLGINATVLAYGGENWAGGNGDNVGCAGVACRWTTSCGTE